MPRRSSTEAWKTARERWGVCCVVGPNDPLTREFWTDVMRWRVRFKDAAPDPAQERLEMQLAKIDKEIHDEMFQKRR